MLSSQDEFRRSSRQQQMVNIGLLGRPVVGVAVVVVVFIAAAVDDDVIIDVVAAVSDSFVYVAAGVVAAIAMDGLYNDVIVVAADIIGVIVVDVLAW